MFSSNKQDDASEAEYTCDGGVKPITKIKYHKIFEKGK